MIKSAYIHVPFCTSICSYCDFCKFYYDERIVSNYLISLEKEIMENYQNEELETIYIGGGTPSSLSLEELKRLLTIAQRFHFSKNYEYTVECNIENITEEKMKLLSDYGVNRISIGIQTFQEKYLKFLNRKNTKKEVFEKIKMVKKYISNINVDLIYAIPGETIEELEDDLNCFLSLNIPHISTYSLIIEEHTLLYNQKIESISEELDLKMYEYIQERLSNYHHYEISNFALSGLESKHNLTYWNNEEYYGFGLGASGYIHSMRYENTRSMNHYLSGNYILKSHVLTEKEKIENEFILGLRKINGISLTVLNKKYSKDFLKSKTIQELLNKGLLIQQQDFLKIPLKYIYVSNDILVHFIDWEEDF